jgi:hypothetical protein
MKFFKRILDFIKQYPGILYSLLLIVFLPLILYYNTFLSAKAFQENVDRNLQMEAFTVENILGSFFSDFFKKPEFIQKKIEEITKQNPEIRNLRIAIEEEGGKFKIIASQNPYEIGGRIKDPSYALSYSQDQVIANLISKNGERFWKVIKPIYDKKEGKKLGIISMTLSLRESDALITKAIYRSYLIVVAVVILTLFLVFQHTRLFGYVSLTKKLKEIDKMKDDFIRMATHELQSPIVNIKGYLQLLEEEIKDSLTSEQKEVFRRIEVSAKNLSDLIYDILEVSRIEQGRLDFTPQKILPSLIIKEVAQEMKLKAQKKGLDFILEIKEVHI